MHCDWLQQFLRADATHRQASANVRMEEFDVQRQIKFVPNYYGCVRNRRRLFAQSHRIGIRNELRPKLLSRKDEQRVSVVIKHLHEFHSTIIFDYLTLICRTSIFDNLLKLDNLNTLKIGCAGACTCTNVTFFVTKLTHIVNLAIESPLRYNNVACRPCSAELNENLGIIIANLSQLKGLRLAHVCKREQNLLELIAQKMPLLQELHLIGYRLMYQQKLLDFLYVANELCVLNFSGTKFTFTVNLFIEINQIIQQRNTTPLAIYLESGVYEPLVSSLRALNAYDNRFVRIYSVNWTGKQQPPKTHLLFLNISCLLFLNISICLSSSRCSE